MGFNHSFYSVNSYHKKKYGMKSSLGWYAAYNYFIDNSGKLFKAREDGEEGCHTKGYNNDIAICLRGNLDEKKPTKQQLKTLEALLKEKQKEHNIPDSEIYGHRDFSNTICPGKYVMEFLNEYRKTTQSTTKPPKTPQKPTEGELNALQKQLNTIKEMIKKLVAMFSKFIS